MKEIVVKVTDEQYYGLECITSSPEEWIENFITGRADHELDQILNYTVKYCLDNNIQVASSKSEIIKYAKSNNLIKTVKQLEEESE